MEVSLFMDLKVISSINHRICKNNKFIDINILEVDNNSRIGASRHSKGQELGWDDLKFNVL